MRRKSARNAAKSSPEKTKKESPSRKSRRHSKRRKPSTSESSDSQDEKPLKQVSQEAAANTSKSHTPSDEENADTSVWQVTPTNTQTGEIQKLKICLTRPTLSTPESPEKSRRTRTRGSPSITDESCSQEDEKINEVEEKEEQKKGKGKSKGKHKSKLEKSAKYVNERESEKSSEFSENVQVTAQSPTIDIPVETIPDANVNVQSNNVQIAETNEEETHAETDEAVQKTIESTNDDDTSKLGQKTTESANNAADTTETSADVEQNAVVVSSEIQINEVNMSTTETDDISKNTIITTETQQEMSTSETIQQCNEPKEDENVPVQVEVEKQENEIENNSQIKEENNAQEKIRSIKEKSDNIEKDDETDKQPEESDTPPVEAFDNESNGTHTSNQNQETKELQESVELEAKSQEVEQTVVEEMQEPTAEASNEVEKAEADNQNVTENISNKVEENESEADCIKDNSTNVEQEVQPVQHETSAEEMEVDLSESAHFAQLTSEIVEESSPSKTPPPQNTAKVSGKSVIIDQPTQPSERRRKWGSTNIGFETMYSKIVKIDIEHMKNLYPNFLFLEEKEVKLESIPNERKKSTESKPPRADRKVSAEEPEKPSLKTQTSVNSVKSEGTAEAEDNSSIIALNRKISIVDDTASKLKPPPSPAKNPMSDILYITNLVRPFTLKQLKELLLRTGKIKEEGFWTDRIKSKCYVQYETTEEAEATRNALHGVQWPIGNGKKLIIDYSTPEELENAKNPPPPLVPKEEPKLPDKEIETPVPMKPREEERDRRKKDAQVREWDIGKEDLHRDRSRSRDRDRKRHNYRSTTPVEDFIAKKHRKVEESVPQKLMDDLFQKTKATPCIYWQPLTPEEIATKQQQRLIRMEEHKRRMEETSRNRGGDFGRGAPYRRRYD